MKNVGGVTFSYHNLAFSLSYPGLFYGILVNLTKVLDADACKVVVSEQNTLPHGLLGYAPVFARKAGSVDAYNFIKVSYTVTEIDLLPPPFQTACRYYSESDELRALCMDKCIINATQTQFGKVPFTSLLEERTSLKPVNNIDVSNDKFSKRLDELEQLCEKNCAQPACETEHYSTSVQLEEDSELDFFTILVQAPTLPTMNVTSGQKVQLSDFLIYVSSCVGTWFGASAITFSPLALRHLLARQGKSCRCLFCHKRRRRLCSQIISMRNIITTFSPTQGRTL